MLAEGREMLTVKIMHLEFRICNKMLQNTK